MENKLLNTQIIKYCAVFIFIFAIANITANILRMFIFPEANIPLAWPISVFQPKIIWPLTLLELPFNYKTISLFSLIPSLVVYSIIFTLIIRNIQSITSKKILYVIGVVSVLLSNLIHGIHGGLFYPTAGGSINYYHDAINIINPYIFISTYNEIQSELLCHSATHPPGPVLLYYYLNEFLGQPEFSSLFIMFVSLLIIYYVYKLLQMYVGKELAMNMGLIFIFIPAIQIYFLSSIDSLISLTFVGIIYYYIQLKHTKNFYFYFMLFFFLFITSFLTYLVVYPLMVIFIDMIYKRNYQIALATSIMAIIIPIIYSFLNYDYISGFFMASHLENPDGFRLLSEPVSYIFTRFENVAEIILFYGPLLTIATYKGIRYNLKEEPIQFVLISIFSLLLLFVAGVARTGETARCFLYIYPLLIIPAAYYLNEFNSENKNYRIKQILITLWIQSILMQIFGFYYW